MQIFNPGKDSVLIGSGYLYAMLADSFDNTDVDTADMTEIGFYRNTSGIMDPAQAEEWAVTADEFWAVDEALAAKTMALSAVPFSAYAASDANPA